MKDVKLGNLIGAIIGAPALIWLSFCVGWQTTISAGLVAFSLFAIYMANKDSQK